MNSGATNIIETAGGAGELALAYETIREDLRRRLGRQWPPGARLPPIKTLARQLGAGQSNTQRAVRALAREGLLVSRPRLGTFVRGGAGAPAVFRPVEGKFIHVLRFTPEPFLDPVVAAVTQRLAQYGAELSAAEHRLRESGALEAHAHADALVLVNPDTRAGLAARPGQHLVVVSTALENPVTMAGGYDVVSVDGEQGGFLAGEHLRRIGCEEVCFVGCGGGREGGYGLTSEARFTGFERGWGRSLPRERRLMVRDYMTSQGARAVSDYLALRPRPAGVFAASDDLALGFVHGALSHGLEPGRDYQIIGFDGQQRGRELSEGPLTTIDAPVAAMGAAAARLLLERFDDPSLPVRRVALGGSLFAGATAVGARRIRRKSAS